MTDATKLLQVTGLNVSLGARQVLFEVDLTVMPGELVAIVGPNGAGKTTLLKAVSGVVPAKGSIAIEDTPLTRLSLGERAKRIAYLPQGHTFHWPLAVEDVVALGRLPRGAGADLSSADALAVSQAMAQTGVEDYTGRSVTALSGGERARVALARVLATEAALILADEPTASLDPRYQLIVLDILQRHAREGGAVIAVLHDLALAARHADRIVVLDQGRVAADGPPRDVFTKSFLEKTFGIDAEIVSVDDAPIVIPTKVIENR
jgi:iron complex transport system ATP-binding protein